MEPQAGRRALCGGRNPNGPDRRPGEVWRTSPGAYRLNLEHTVGYLLKDASTETARVLGLQRKERNPEWDVGGVVIGKRWGRSQNLATGDGTADRRTGRKRLTVT